MVFWGAVVKPNKPVVVSCGKDETRLRLTQATLGFGSNDKEKCLLQCSVGRNSPVLLCALLPNQVESFLLDLEFDEADVSFSVIGTRSIHLTGYYVHHTTYPNTDMEPHGIDIENTDTDGSSRDSDYDKEDSFIDDTDLQHSPEPLRLGKKHKEKEDKPKKLKKKMQVIESDDDSELWDTDDDGYLLSVFKRSSKKTTVVEGSTSRVKHDINDKLENGSELKEKEGELNRSTKADDERNDVPNKILPVVGEGANKEDASLDCEMLEDKAPQDDVKHDLPCIDEDQIEDHLLFKTSEDPEMELKVQGDEDSTKVTVEKEAHRVFVLPDQFQQKTSINGEDNGDNLVLEADKAREEEMLTRTSPGDDAAISNNSMLGDETFKAEVKISDKVEKDLLVDDALNNDETMDDAGVTVVPPDDGQGRKRSAKKKKASKKKKTKTKAQLLDHNSD